MAEYTSMSDKQPGIGDGLGMPLIDDAQKELPGSDKVPMIGEGIGFYESPEASMQPASMGGGNTTSAKPPAYGRVDIPGDLNG